MDDAELSKEEEAKLERSIKGKKRIIQGWCDVESISKSAFSP